MVFLWPLYCLSFSRFSFDHYTVSPLFLFVDGLGVVLDTAMVLFVAGLGVVSDTAMVLFVAGLGVVLDTAMVICCWIGCCFR